MTLTIKNTIINGKYLFKLIILIGLIFIFLGLNSAQAEEFLYLRAGELLSETDYVLTSPDRTVSLRLAAQGENHSLLVKMMALTTQDKINHFFTYDESIRPASNLFLVRLKSMSEPERIWQPEITIQYQPNDQYKELYYYNWANLQFEKWPSVRDTIKNTITFKLPERPSVIFALFDEPHLEGNASWYVHPRYPNEDMAAAVDFARGTKLRVVNLENDKSVVVTVKDYGPDQNIHSDRVIDLSKIAFQKLASTRQGIIRVRVMPVDDNF